MHQLQEEIGLKLTQQLIAFQVWILFGSPSTSQRMQIVQIFNKIKGLDLFEKRKEETKKAIVYNHYENISVLSTKTGLLKTLRDYYQQNKQAIECSYKVQDTLPQAYIITSNPNDYEFTEFKKKIANIEKGYVYNERLTPKQYEQNFWLLKPANMNQGKGIEIFNTLRQVQSFLTNKPQEQLWIVQKYIEKPLLYHQRKFDIRVLALGTNEFDLFFYNTGYMRTSSDAYTLDNKNKFVHLTNNCYQKNSNNYQKFEQGNQLTFTQFQEYLDETFPDLNVSFDNIMLRIKDLVIDCFAAGINQYNPNRRENMFEVMGFDFMIDEDFRVWLIEVNTNPYFGVLNDKLPRFIDNLVDDTFRLTIDKIFPRELEDSDRKTDYELLYSVKQSDQERDLNGQKQKQQKVDQPNQYLNKQITLQVVDQNVLDKNKLKMHKNFYMTIEGSTRSKSALSFNKIEGKESKRMHSKENKVSKKFKNNQNFTKNQIAISLKEDLSTLQGQDQNKTGQIGLLSPINDINDLDYVESIEHSKLKMAQTQFSKSPQKPIGQTSLTILLRKKADESTRVTKLNQNEYLSNIQRMLKVKNLLDQIKESIQNVGENHEQKKKEFTKIFNHIFLILSNPSSNNKKDVASAIQGLKLLIFSSFIIHFNEKTVISKLLDLLKVQHQDIKENTIKCLHELSKHFAIRTLLLNRKILSKFAKIIIEQISIVDQDQTEKDHTLLMIQQLAIISSVSNNKFYIPGETKEIEQLRKKSITNGLIIISDILLNISLDSSNKNKIKSEILDNMGINDHKLNFYTIFQHFKGKIEIQNEINVRESLKDLKPEVKEKYLEILNQIENDQVFTHVKSYIDQKFKIFKSKLPKFIDAMTEYFNIDKLLIIFQNLKDLIITNKDKPQNANNNSQQIKKQTLDRHSSLIKDNFQQTQLNTENIISQEFLINQSFKLKKLTSQSKDQSRKKNDKPIPSINQNLSNINTEISNANQTFQNQTKIERINKYVSNRNSQPNNKSYERINDSVQEVNILKRPYKNSKGKRIQSLRSNINSKTLLPVLQGNIDQTKQNATVFSTDYVATKDHSIILPNLNVGELSNKKQGLYYGIGTNFYNQGGYNKVLQEAQQYLKLQPYLQNNSASSKNSSKLKNHPKNEYQNLTQVQSSSALGSNSSKRDIQQILPLSQNIMKSNYYKSGFMTKVRKQGNSQKNEVNYDKGMYYNYQSTTQSEIINQSQKKPSIEALPQLQSERNDNTIQETHD